jgi:hypothetical protein
MLLGIELAILGRDPLDCELLTRVGDLIEYSDSLSPEMAGLGPDLLLRESCDFESFL